MRKLLAKLLSWIDQQEISIGGWIAAFTGVLLIRVLFEAFSNRSMLEFIPPSALDIAHYWLFFFAVAIGIMGILTCFTGNAPQAAKVVLFGLPIIWLAPLFDLAVSGGTGIKMGYIGSSKLLDFVVEYFVFLWPSIIAGVTPGMQLEIAILLVGLGLYIWLSRKSVGKALGAMLAVYTLIFLMGALPSLIFLLVKLFSSVAHNTSLHAMDFFQRAIAASNISSNHLPPTVNFTTPAYAAQAGFDHFMGQALYLIALFLAAGFFYRGWPGKFRSVIKNCRPERIIFYLAFLGLGMLFATARTSALSMSWIDGVSIVVLALSWCGVWMYAIHINDIFDQDIDAISSPNRPLARGTLSVGEMHQSAFAWLAVSLLGSASVGYYPFFMNLIFVACSYIYSAPPLRLRRIPILSSFLIALAVLSSILAGFFFLSPDKKLAMFPMSLMAGVLFIFTLGVNIRDLKDVKGDKAEGVWTLPVLFKKRGAQITGALFALSFLLTPLVFRAPVLWYTAIPASVAAYAVAVHKPYEEKRVFILYFVFVAVGVALFELYPPAFNLF